MGKSSRKGLYSGIEHGESSFDSTVAISQDDDASLKMAQFNEIDPLTMGRRDSLISDGRGDMADGDSLGHHVGDRRPGSGVRFTKHRRCSCYRPALAGSIVAAWEIQGTAASSRAGGSQHWDWGFPVDQGWLRDGSAQCEG